MSRSTSPVPSLPELGRQRTREYEFSTSDSSDSDTDSPEVVDLWQSYVNSLPVTTSSGRVIRPPQRLTPEDVYNAAHAAPDPVDEDEDIDMTSLERKYEEETLHSSGDDDFVDNREDSEIVEEVQTQFHSSEEEESLTEQSDTDNDGEEEEASEL